jgi:hypothetical protein
MKKLTKAFNKKNSIKILIILAGVGLLLTTFLPFIPYIVFYFSQ